MEMTITEQIRQWLIAHEFELNFTEKNYTRRTFRATKMEWEEFYRLLSPIVLNR